MLDWDIMKEDTTELRNIKSKLGLKKLIIHQYIDNFNNFNFGIGMGFFIEKLVPNSEISYIIYPNDLLYELTPVITTNSLYFIEHKTNVEDCLKEIIRCKKQVESLELKLSNENFIKNAPQLTIDFEIKKLDDFKKRWEKASIAYSFI